MSDEEEGADVSLEQLAEDTALSGGFDAMVSADVLQSVPVTLSVEVGRTRLKIRDLLRLKQGSVIELERNAGEPLDLLVNNTVVAQGEVVLVNDRYGVRLTRILPSEDRVEKL
ncbi:flagellar motor switch protein FliN [Luminiphilus sp.]|jgi:flagellar motor switch protein FliN/FliY|nr:flagellar motor switch protein FliN [Luminiphilus sp.]MDA8553823.1 flagellar motor switch protein FliN [Luminiphilus sp.]MDA8619964.1 flagellar motor switch protein FliN [Luminiphilus sp.]MDB2364983.1 flagellar motor switch protein FliN [Luminiphilus sp.]MDC0573758.1 flagellar motor switch protein FliN [Luminiphilus sp.]